MVDLRHYLYPSLLVNLLRWPQTKWVLSLIWLTFLTSHLIACSSSGALGVREAADSWKIQETVLGEGYYRLIVSRSFLKSLSNGGDGQLIKVVQQRAEQLRLAGHYEQYTIKKYSESVIAGSITSERVAEADIVLSAPKKLIPGSLLP